MKADVVTVTINGHTTLKVVLIPQNEEERAFLEKASNEVESWELHVGEREQ